MRMFPELYDYHENCGAFYRDLNRPYDRINLIDIGRYEIIFEAGQRYYCYIDAINMDEALGIFFKNHPHVTYEMIIDHMEV